MKYLVIIVFAFSVAFSAEAQILGLYNQELKNGFSINSSQAGVNGSDILWTSYRNQWTNIAAAPKHTGVNYHSNIGKGMGLGGKFFNYQSNIFSISRFEFTWAYHAKLTQESFLDFGLLPSFTSEFLNFSQVTIRDAGDPLVSTYDRTTNSVFNVGFAMAYRKTNFNIGIQVNNLVQPEMTYNKTDNLISSVNNREIVFHGSYDVKINEEIDFSPLLITRFSKGANFQYDFMPRVIFNKNYWGAFVLRNTSIGVMAGLNLSQYIGMYYSFENNTSHLGGQAGPSHEIGLAINVGDRFNKAVELRTKNLKQEIAQLNQNINSLKVKVFNDSLVSFDDRKDEKLKSIRENRYLASMAEKYPNRTFYVIQTSHVNQAGANEVAKYWQNKGFDTKVIYSENYRKYYVYFFKTASVYDAFYELLDLKELGITHAWILIE